METLFWFDYELQFQPATSACLINIYSFILRSEKKSLQNRYVNKCRKAASEFFVYKALQWTLYHVLLPNIFHLDKSQYMYFAQRHRAYAGLYVNLIHGGGR